MATKKVEVIANEKIEDISSGGMTKAGRLAMELANEKKRLNQELKELQAEWTMFYKKYNVLFNLISHTHDSCLRALISKSSYL